MAKEKHGVVRLDRMYGTDIAANLISVMYMGANGDAKTKIDNGSVVAVGELIDLEREVYKGTDVKSQASPIAGIALIASVETLYDERKRNLYDFYNDAGKICRAFLFHDGDIFSVTKESLAGNEIPAIGDVVELKSGTKLNIVKTTSDNATVVGRIIDIDHVGLYTYYVIMVGATNAATGDANMSIPDANADPGGIEGKKVSDLIGDDISISWDGVSGTVKGTLNSVTEWKQFSNSEKEQSGHYFPISLDSKYSGKDVKVTGSKVKTAQDTEWVLRVDDCKQFTFECDGKTILKLDFNDATCK